MASTKCGFDTRKWRQAAFGATTSLVALRGVSAGGRKLMVETRTDFQSTVHVRNVGA